MPIFSTSSIPAKQIIAELGRIAAISIFILLLFGSIEAVRFAHALSALKTAEPCRKHHLEPGLRLNIWLGESHGIHFGALHGYAGPGELYLELGVTPLVVALHSPRCH